MTKMRKSVCAQLKHPISMQTNYVSLVMLLEYGMDKAGNALLALPDLFMMRQPKDADAHQISHI